MTSKAIVPGLVLVTVLATFLTVIEYTPTGWKGTIGNTSLTYIDGSQGFQEATVIADIDGIESSWGLTMTTIFGTPDKATLQFVAEGDTSAQTTLVFDPLDPVRLTGRRITMAGGSPQWMIQVSNSADFDSIMVSVNNGKVGTTWPMGVGDWYVRALRFDPVQGLYGHPTHVVGFEAPVPPPPPPPGVLTDVRWLSGWDLQWTYAGKTGPEDVSLSQNGVNFPMGSWSSSDSLTWKSYMGAVRESGTQVFTANGDTVGWVEP